MSFAPIFGGFGAGGAAGVGLIGFTALKPTTANAAGSVITDWTTEHWDPRSEFDPVTGRFQPAATARLYWIAAGGLMFQLGGTETQLRLRKNGANQVLGRAYTQGTDHRWTHYIPHLFQVAAGDYFEAYQVSDAAEQAWFSGFAFDAGGVGFAATRSAAAGSTNAVIDGYTEAFDLGADFDPVTGIFTAPSTGYYLTNAAGFPTGGMDGGTWGIAHYLDGVKDFVAQAYQASGADGFGYSVGHSLLLHLTAGQELKLHQESTRAGETAESVAFSVAKLPDPTVGFAARKAASSGAAGDVVSGWTEDFDVGAAFDAAAGIFTAANAGPHLVLSAAHEDPAAANTDPAPEVQLIHTPSGGSATTFQRSFHRIGSNRDSISSHGIGMVIDLGAGDQLHLKQVTHPLGNCFFAAYEI